LQIPSAASLWASRLPGIVARGAFGYLEKAFADDDDELIFCMRYPVFDSMRSDPRYADLMRRLGLPE
jgi:hypothetical protein